MRVLLGVVGVLLLLIVVAGLVLGAVCGVDVDDVAYELGVEGFEAEVPSAAPTINACAECLECARHDARVACNCDAIDTNDQITIYRHGYEEALEASGAAGVQHGTADAIDTNDQVTVMRDHRDTTEALGAAGVQRGSTPRHYDFVATNDLGSGRFTGAPA